jgi:peptide deformylase
MTKFVTVPDPSLRKRSKPVEKIDQKILKWIKELKKALVEAHDPPGVGLSAVQIGKPIRIFLARKDVKFKPKVFINPEITWQSKAVTDGVPNRQNKLEGCLSVPNYYGIVHRAKQIKLRWQDESRQRQTAKFSGFLATVIQHEMDHINGILFIDRVLEQGNKLYQIEDEKLVETSL